MLNDIFGSAVYNYQASYTLGIHNYHVYLCTKSIQLLLQVQILPLDTMNSLSEGPSACTNIRSIVTRTLGVFT